MNVAANQTTLDLSVDGMTCGSCVRHVTEALRSVGGVTEAQVDLQGKTARVTYDPQSTTPDALIRAVEEAGYQATPSRSGRMDSLPIRCGCGSSCCA